jgi:Ca2+/Na+ antiporter
MTIVWLCLLTYLMVWMVTIIGFTFGIPDSVMGITFLAAGSSVPDALSSVLVVRQGMSRIETR